MPTVLVTDYNYGDLSIERPVFKEAGVEVVTAQATEPSDIVEAAKVVDADALIAQYAPVTREVIVTLPDLIAVGRYGVGVDNVDVDAATDHGVVVLNVPDYCHHEVAEHALALILDCVRKVARYDRTVRDGEWDWEHGAPIRRLAGSTLGLVGFGAIPSRLAEKVSGLSLNVIGYDPYVDADEFAAHGVEKVDFSSPTIVSSK